MIIINLLQKGKREKVGPNGHFTPPPPTLQPHLRDITKVYYS